ncbi:MAG: GTP-binding protein, partial [Candidatus Thorarchaeota archaeon]
GRPDNGSGRARSFLLTHPQEIVKGQTADIHLAFMGFTADGSRVHIENPLNRQEAAMALDRSAKIITFFDAPGHQEFSKTMIRSILGSDAQYGMVLIPVPDEAELVLGEESRTGTRRLDDITREHIILMVGRRVPFMILLSMVDRATHEYVELVLGVVRETVKETGRIPVLVRTWDDAQPVLREMPNGAIVPIIPVSAVDMQSLDLLTRILRDLPIDTSSTDVSSPAFAYIDKVYRGVRGTNIVVTGTVKQGVFKRGQMVQIGPDENGQMMEGRLFSIEVFKRRVSAVKVGDLFGFDIKDVDKHRIRRGQVVMDVDGNAPNSVRTIEANIVVTRHPTRIVEGYTPVLQCHTIQQPVVLKKIYDRDYLAVGDFARVRLEFMLRPEIVNVNDKIVLREANTRAIGTVVEIVR